MQEVTRTEPWVAIAAFGAGLMFSGMPALIIAHIVDHTTPDTYGPAFSAATLAFGVTQMISPQVGGLLADYRSRVRQPPAQPCTASAGPGVISTVPWFSGTLGAVEGTGCTGKCVSGGRSDTFHSSSR